MIICHKSLPTFISERMPLTLHHQQEGHEQTYYKEINLDIQYSRFGFIHTFSAIALTHNKCEMDTHLTFSYQI